MGDPDQPHSYSYTPDVAAALSRSAPAAGATGQVWHLPVAETRTTRAARRGRCTGSPGTARACSRPAGRRCARSGLVKPEMREYLHTLYQFTDPWVVDDGKFRAAFGDLVHAPRRRARHDPRLVRRPGRRTRP